MRDFLKSHFPPQLCLYNPPQSSIIGKTKRSKGRQIGRRRKKERKWYSFLDFSSKCELVLDIFNQTKLFFNYQTCFHQCSWAIREFRVGFLSLIHQMRGMWAMVTWSLILDCATPILNLYILVYLFSSNFFFSFLLIHHLND